MFELSYKTKRIFFERPKKKIDKRKSRKVTMIKKSNDEESQQQKT